MRKIDVTALHTVDAPTLSPAAQLLLDAADWMQEHGKAGPGMAGMGPRGEVCIATAAVVCNGGKISPHNHDAMELMADYLCRRGELMVTLFSDTNDTPTVLAAMRSAAYGSAS